MTIVDSSSSSSTEIVLTETNNDNDNDNKNKLFLDQDNNNGGITKKKKKSVNILKVALMLLRRRFHKPNAAAADVASKGLWNRLVGSMRPLHLQSNQSPEQVAVGLPSSLPSIEPVPVGLCASPSVESFEDVSSLPFSPNHVPQSSCSFVDSMSRYASAVNLQELDQNNDKDEDENAVEVEVEANMNGGDEMIDSKAEMFIAQFYEQMRLQRSDSDLHYSEMIKRSIG